MFNFHSPLNFTSIGQSGYNIFRELVKKTDVALFPINRLNLAIYNLSQEQTDELNKSLINADNFSRQDASLKFYHIAGSEESVSARPNLFTFHETDRLTPFEVNRLNQNEVVFVSSKYTKQVFEGGGVTAKVVYCPLGFDSSSFYRIEGIEKDYITFGLRGKLESRKNTIRILRAWIKVFGGDPRYRLDCSIHNAFYSNEEQSALIINSLVDKCLPWNVNILPYSDSNTLYNKALNYADIDLTGMSGCEGFNLPLFQSLALGKQAIVLNAHVHKDFCNSENSILIEPNGMVDAVDGKFFIEGSKVSQGQWFDFKEKDLIEAMVFAAERGPIRNREGEKLQSWTYENTAKIILENCK